MRSFRTVLKESVSELVIQKSRFITYLIPVRSEEEASKNLERIRKQHWDASHHVPAWVLETGAQKFSDDGEPGGTAGLPVLEALKHGGMQNCQLLVVRYFGGVKLGTGGLVRAYGQAAREALSAAECYEVSEFDYIRAMMDYTLLGRIQAYLSQKSVVGLEILFTEKVDLRFFTLPASTEKIKEDLTDLTHGSVEISLLDTELLAVNGKDFLKYDQEGTL